MVATLNRKIHCWEDNSERLWYSNGTITLRYDKELYCKLYYNNGKVVRSLNDAVHEAGTSKPAYLIVAGDEIIHFNLRRSSIKNIKNVHGKGKRLTIIANSSKQIELKLTTELYLRYPNIAIMYATFSNIRNLAVQSIWAPFYVLDASLADPRSMPNEFYSFQGASIRWGRPYANIPITRDFVQENCMWTKYPTRFSQGSGVPIIDLWTRPMGLAIACVEPVPQLIRMPIHARSDQKVEVGIEIPTKVVGLEVSDSYSTPKHMIVVHSGDFFEALKTFREVMADNGIAMKESPAAAYEPIWNSWGYELLWKPKHTYDVLPVIKRMGIKWVSIEPPWFPRFGDWKPNRSLFPGAEKEFTNMIDYIHEKGFKVKLWWAPLYSVRDRELTNPHLGMFVNDSEGRIPEVSDSPDFTISGTGYSILCPANPEFQEFVRKMTLKIFRDWKIDGLFLDLMHGSPPCYNIKHQHKSPWESCQMYPEMYKIIYQTAILSNPKAVVMICPCGVVGDFFSFQWQNQWVTADPIGSSQVRIRLKVFKALIDPNAAVNADHVELTSICYGPEQEIDAGDDFASAIGSGGVIATKFALTSPDDKRRRVDITPHKVTLTQEKKAKWVKWIHVYNERLISKGEYMNLYDIAYDKPETHVIRKDGKLYFSFYAPHWDGTICLKGLGKGTYRLHDYEKNIKLGTVTGKNPTIFVKFNNHLLLEACQVNKRAS